MKKVKGTFDDAVCPALRPVRYAVRHALGVQKIIFKERKKVIVEA